MVILRRIRLFERAETWRDCNKKWEEEEGSIHSQGRRRKTSALLAHISRSLVGCCSACSLAPRWEYLRQGGLKKGFLQFPDMANIEFSPLKLVKYITRDHLSAAAQHIEKVCVDKKILERKKWKRRRRSGTLVKSLSRRRRTAPIPH